MSTIKIKPSHKGLLHKKLGIPEGEPIPASKLTIKSSDSPALKKEKQFAKNFKKADNGLFQPSNNFTSPFNFQQQAPIYQPQRPTQYNLPEDNRLQNVPQFTPTQSAGVTNDKNIFPWQQYIAPALSTIDALIPNKKTALPYLHPTDSYNPYPQGTGSTVLAKNGKKVKMGDGGNKKPPIYTTDPNDPRLKAYQDSVFATKNVPYNYYDKMGDSVSGNTVRSPSKEEAIALAYKGIKPTTVINYKNGIAPYEYKEPVQPIIYQSNNFDGAHSFNKDKSNSLVRVLSTPKEVNKSVSQQPLVQMPPQGLPQIPNPVTNPQQIKSYQMQGNQPIYGPSHALLGMMDNNSFYPDYTNTSGRTAVNQPDNNLIQDQQALHSYLQNKGFNGQIKKQFANGGNLTGNNLQVEDNQYTPLSPSIFQINGEKHANGGTDINFGNTTIEAEKGETATIGQDGSLNIFGNLKVPSTNMKFKEAGKRLAEMESKYAKKSDKYTKIAQNADDKFSLNSANAGLRGTALNQQTVQQDKERLSTLQEAMLQMAKQRGVDPKKLFK